MKGYIAFATEMKKFFLGLDYCDVFFCGRHKNCELLYSRRETRLLVFVVQSLSSVRSPQRASKYDILAASKRLKLVETSSYHAHKLATQTPFASTERHSLSWSNVSMTVQRKGMDDLQVLSGIDGSIRSNKLCCILGHSGSGKTSLLSVLAGKAVTSGGICVKREVHRPLL